MPSHGLRVSSVADEEVALVWLDGRFERFLPNGRYAYWSRGKEVSVQTVKPDAQQVRFDGLDAMLQERIRLYVYQGDRGFRE